MTLLAFVLTLLAGAIGGATGNIISDKYHDSTHKDPQEVVIVQPKGNK